MALLNFSLFINNSTIAPVPDDVSTSDSSSDTDRMQEYIRANYNNDSFQENTENVDINTLQASVSKTKEEVIQTIKEKPSFGLDDMASVKSVKQKAEENNRVAEQQVINVEETANANNQVAEEKVQDEENSAAENNKEVQEDVNNAESSVESIQQKVTAAEQTLNNAKNSLSEVQNALNNATTDEEKEAAKLSLEKAENEVAEAEKALDAAKQELNKAQEGLNKAKTNADTIQKEGEQAIQAAKSNANKVKEEGTANINNAEANKEKILTDSEKEIVEVMTVSAEELFQELDTNNDNILNANDYVNMELLKQYELEELGIQREADVNYNSEEFAELIKQKEQEGITTGHIYLEAVNKYNEVKQNDKAYQNYLYSKEHVDELSAHPKIKNDYYEGECSYTREFNENSIIITNTDTQEKTTLDLTNLLAPFDDSDKSKLIAAFKQMPAESLLDLNTEVLFTNKKIEKGSDGNYDSMIDKVTVSGGTMCVETIVHELGHALDNRHNYYKDTECYGVSYFVSENQNFSTVFQDELAEYKKLFKQPTQIHSWNEQTKSYDVTTNRNATFTGTDYAALNEKEMFAECYTLCMLGHCQSMETITKYFPKSLEAAKEIITSTRQLSQTERQRKDLV